MNKPKSMPRAAAPPVYRPVPPQQAVQGKVPQKTPLLPPPVYRPNAIGPARIAPPKQAPAPSGIQPKVGPVPPASRRPVFPVAPYRPLVIQRAASATEPLVTGVGVRQLVKVGKSIWGDCRELLTSIKGDLMIASRLAKEHKSTTSKVVGVVSTATSLADKATHFFPPAKLVTTPLHYAVKIAKALSFIKDLVDLLGKNPIEGVPLLLVDHLEQLHAALENAVFSLEGLESDDKLLEVLEDIKAGIGKVKGWIEAAS